MVLVSAVIAFTFGLIFLGVYTLIHDRKNQVAVNAWWGALAYVIISLSAILLELGYRPVSDRLAMVAFSIAAVVLAWRSVILLYYRRVSTRREQRESKLKEDLYNKLDTQEENPDGDTS